jgi:hypothetical protein
VTQGWLRLKETEHFFGVRNLYAYRAQLVLEDGWP